MKKIILFSLTFTVILVLDIIWIFLFALPIYKNQINPFVRSEMNLLSGIITYILISFSIYYFSIKEIDKKTKKEIILSSSIIGFLIYSIYGLTNYTILNFWTIPLLLTDAVWGTVLGLISSLVITFLYYNYLIKLSKKK